MTESILNHKKLLIVDDEPDILVTLEEEILQSLRIPKSTRQVTMKMPLHC